VSDASSPSDPPDPAAADLPFPDSLCHQCAAPPRYVRSARSVFIMCPVLPNKYPRQPVRECPMFRPRDSGP
jgi:hypothetical protein